MNQDNAIKVKRQQFTYNFRKMDRMNIINQKRLAIQKNYLYIPEYVQKYDQMLKQAIIESINGQIPNPLGPLSITTISYYRRLNLAVYQIRLKQQIDPHLLHESLWILSNLQPQQFGNYESIAAEFEQNLSIYLSAKYSEIVEMAIIVAGNKILGLQPQIVKIIELGHMWVAINHIYANRISPTYVFRGIIQQNSNCLQCIYQLSNTNKDVIDLLMLQQHYEVLQKIVEFIAENRKTLNVYGLRIVGNILSTKQEYADELIRLQIIDVLNDMLTKEKKKQVKQQICWALSNIANGSTSQANVLLNNVQLVEKLLSMLEAEIVNIQLEIIYIFGGIIKNGHHLTIFKLLNQTTLLDSMKDLLQEDNLELQHSIMKILQSILRLGQEHFRDQNDQDLMRIQLRRMNFRTVLQEHCNEKMELDELYNLIVDQLDQ